MQMTMVKGEEFYLGFRFKWPDMTPKDLTNYYVLIQIRPFKNSKNVIASFNHTSPQVLFVPEAGAIDLQLTPLDTHSYDFKNGVMDCWVRNASNTDGDRTPTIELIFDTGVSR